MLVLVMHTEREGRAQDERRALKLVFMAAKPCNDIIT